MMKWREEEKMDKQLLIIQARKDLSIGMPFTASQPNPVANCWHFSSDGNFADVIFYNKKDFVAAINRIARIYLSFDVLILAFCLMDNHFHFVLYGSFKECEAFINKFVQLTSHYISVYHKERSKLAAVPISHTAIEDTDYLKNAICYDFRNPPVNGLKYTFYDYPWSSGGLYFRNPESYYSPLWMTDKTSVCNASELLTWTGEGQNHRYFSCPTDWTGIDGMIHPRHFVAVELVEEVFVTVRAFNYCAGKSNEKTFDKQVGRFNMIRLDDTEIRQHRDAIAMELYGNNKIRSLSVPQRIELAQVLRRRFSSSPKQIARAVCLSYEEIKLII